MKERIVAITALLVAIFSITAEPVRVACVGDSITYGSGIADRESNSYPAVLAGLLNDDFKVQNFGVGGARVSKTSRKPYLNTPEFKASIDFNPDIVVIALGINDTSINEWERNSQRFKQDYLEIIDKYKSLQSKPKIYLASLMPVFLPYKYYHQIQPNIEQAQLLIKELGDIERLGVIDLYSPLVTEPSVYSRDGLHPSKAGAEIIAKTIYKSITGNFGGLKLADIFGDNMMIQRDMPVRVWGVADSGKLVNVEFAGKSQTAIADINGRWLVEFEPLSEGGSLSLKVQSYGKVINIENILIGDIWLCSGQSNMAWQFKQDGDYAQEKIDTDYPNIRLLKLTPSVGTANRAYTQEQIDFVQVDNFFSGRWIASSQQMQGDVSAVGYYFARHLHRQTSVPIGIIDCSIGGSTMESWMPKQAFDTPSLSALLDNWLFSEAGPDWVKQRARENLSLWQQAGAKPPMPHHPYEPCFLYNSGIKPIGKLNIKGVLWYQGESNATQADGSIARENRENRLLFEKLIESWRDNFNQPDLPFYYVQLPGLERNWMDYRQMQLEAVKSIPNTAMAVTIDLGDRKNVHPKYKKQVGKRLSLLAMHNLYGRSDMTSCSPLPKKVSIQDDMLIIEFEYAAGGLAVCNGDCLRYFELCFGEDCREVEAKINGSNVEILLDGRKPSSVRYGWKPFIDSYLINKAGLPASPFKIDID